MWWMKREEGATVITVAITLLVLFGTGALVLDAGNLFWERRQLQNSADAAALAVAIDCAQGDCGTYDSTATEYALANNPRGAFVEDIAPAGLSHASGSVTVTARTGTETGDAPSGLTYWLATVLGFDEGFARARATAIWKPADASYAHLPLTVSMCDIQDALGFDIEPGVDISDQLPTDPVTITFHNSQDPHDECSTQPGFDADEDGKLPAGFGWLAEDEVDVCQIKVAATADEGFYWAYKDPGNNPIRHCLEAALGKTVVVPVFIDFERASPRDRYLLWAPAGFHLTGYRFPGIEAGDPGCSPPKTCISGYFDNTIEPGSDPTGDTGLGVHSVRLTE